MPLSLFFWRSRNNKGGSRRAAEMNAIDQDELAIFKLYRERIIHEYDLINHRMIWLITSQAFLVALWAALSNMKLKSDFLLSIVDFVGAIFVSIIMGSINAAHNEIEELRQDYFELYPNDNVQLTRDKIYQKRPMSRRSARRDILPGLTGSRANHMFGHNASKYLPYSLLLMWVVLFFSPILPDIYRQSLSVIFSVIFMLGRTHAPMVAVPPIAAT